MQPATPRGTGSLPPGAYRPLLLPPRLSPFPEDLLNRLLGPPLGQHPMDDAMCLLGGEGMA